MTASLPVQVTVPDDVLWQRVDDRVVLLDLRSAEYHALNESGTTMWTLLVESDDVSTARDRLCSIYAASETVLVDDLAHFIAELADSGLLTIAP